MSPLRLIRRDVGGGHTVTTWQPDPRPWEFTEVDVTREAATLDLLADETARTDPWTAALKTFGERP